MNKKHRLTALALALTCAQAGAATIPVGNGCTLPDAIEAANHNTPVGGLLRGR